MICPKCGFSSDNEDKYCRKCGAQFGTPFNNTIELDIKNPEVTEKIYTYLNNEEVKKASLEESKIASPKKVLSSKKKLFLLLSVSLIVLLGVFFSVKSYTTSAMVKDHLQNGTKLLSENKYNDAILEFEKVLKIKANNVDAQIGIAKSYLGLGKYKETLVILNKGYTDTKADAFKTVIEDLKTKVSIEDINERISQGSAFTLPGTVKVKIDNQDIDFNVSWNTSVADTVKSGVYNFTGKLELIEKVVNLKLTVFGILPVEDIMETVQVGQKYSLPKKLKLKMSDNSVGDFEILWNKSETDTSKVGTYKFEGVVKDHDIKLNLILNVQIPDISDKNITTLLSNAFSSVGELVRLAVPNSFKGEDGNYYNPLPQNLSSYEKVSEFFNRYWTENSTKKLLIMFNPRYVYGKYCIDVGDAAPTEWNTAKILAKKLKDNTMEINCRVNVLDETEELKVIIVFENGKWVVETLGDGFGLGI